MIDSANGKYDTLHIVDMSYTIFIIQSLIIEVSPYIYNHNDGEKPCVDDIKQVHITSRVPLKSPKVFIPW